MSETEHHSGSDGEQHGDWGDYADDGSGRSKVRKANPPQGLPPKVLVACVYCRHRRIRCDGLTPCTSCAQRGRECQYPTEPPKKRGPKGKGAKLAETPVATPTATSTTQPGAATSKPRGVAAQQRAPTVKASARADDGEDHASNGRTLRGAGATGTFGIDPRGTMSLPETRSNAMFATARPVLYAPTPNMGGSESQQVPAPLFALPMPMGAPGTQHVAINAAHPVQAHVPDGLLHHPMMYAPRFHAPLPQRTPAEAGLFPLPSERDLRAIESFFVNLNCSIRCVDEESFNHNLSQWLQGCSAATLHPAMPRLWWCAHSGIEPPQYNPATRAKTPELSTYLHSSMDHYSALTSIDRAQIAQYFAVLAIGYRLLRGRDGKPAAETPLLADSLYEKARALALSTMDDPSYPLISALLCMAHYSVGLGKMVAATIHASVAWRLARACGLNVDDGALGSACRFFRQVVCTDLDPLPLTARHLPMINRQHLESSPTPSGSAATANTLRIRVDGTRNTHSSTSGSSASDGVASTTPTAAPSVPAKWMWNEGPMRGDEGGGVEKSGPESNGWTAPLNTSADSKSISSEDTSGQRRNKPSNKRIYSWFGEVLDSGVKPTLSLGQALLGERAGRGLVMKEHLDSCWGTVHIKDGAVVLQQRRDDGTQHPLKITAHYLDMRIQELMGYALSRMMHIGRNMATTAQKKEVWAVVEELVDISCIPGVELGPGRLATIYGLQAITSRQAGNAAQAEFFANQAVELWGSLKLSQTSHSFLMSFVARHVALITLSVELSQTVQDILAGHSHASGSSSEHDNSSEKSSFVSTIDDSRKSSSRGTTSGGVLLLPALSEYRGFFTLATMIGSVANHWPVCAKMYHGMMTEAAAMHAASAERLRRHNMVASSQALASMSEYLAGSHHQIPKLLKTISGHLPDLPASHVAEESATDAASLTAQMNAAHTQMLHAMVVNLLKVHTTDGEDQNESNTSVEQSPDAVVESSKQLPHQYSTDSAADNADTNSTSAAQHDSLFSPLDLLCQVVNHEQPLPVPSHSKPTPDADVATEQHEQQTTARSGAADAAGDGEAHADEQSDASVQSVDGSGTDDDNPAGQWRRKRKAAEDNAGAVVFEHHAENQDTAILANNRNNGGNANTSAHELLPPPPPAVRESSAVSCMSAVSHVPQSASELQQARRTAHFAERAFSASGPAPDSFRGHIMLPDRSYSFGGGPDDVAPADTAFASPELTSFSRAADGRSSIAGVEALPPLALSAFLGSSAPTPPSNLASSNNQGAGTANSGVGGHFVTSMPVAGVKRPHPNPATFDPGLYNLYGPAVRLTSTNSVTPSGSVKRPRVMQLQQQQYGGEHERRGSLGSVAEFAPPSPTRMPENVSPPARLAEGMLSLTPAVMAAAGSVHTLSTPSLAADVRLQSDAPLNPTSLLPLTPAHQR